MLYSKNGSIPYPQTDGSDGWIEVADKPEAPEGKEVVWWFPPGWVIRDPMPVREGFKYSWSQSSEQWTEYEIPAPLTTEQTVALTTDSVSSLATDQISALTTDQISALTGGV
jgi:hypothetical protein